MKKIRQTNKEITESLVFFTSSHQKPTLTETIDTSDWKTYKNEEYGFEVSHPTQYSVSETLEANGIGMYLGLSPEKNQGEVVQGPDVQIAAVVIQKEREMDSFFEINCFVGNSSGSVASKTQRKMCQNKKNMYRGIFPAPLFNTLRVHKGYLQTTFGSGYGFEVRLEYTNNYLYVFGFSESPDVKKSVIGMALSFHERKQREYYRVY